MRRNLKAEVVRVTGFTKHAIGSVVDGELASTHKLPPPAWVEIIEEEGGAYLLRLNAEGHCLADTWHRTVDEAKGQANREFSIPLEAWIENPADNQSLDQVS